MKLSKLAKWSIVAVALIACGGCGTVVDSQHNTTDYTSVDAAATGGDIAAVRTALDHNPSLIRSTEWNGETLLHDAVAHNEEAMAAFLIGRGANVNARDKSGLMPIHIAAQNGDVAIIRLLAGHGADLNSRDGRGWTPLDRALKWHHSNAADLLRSLGARSTLPPANKGVAAVPSPVG